MYMNDFLIWACGVITFVGKILLVCLMVELIVIAVSVIIATTKVMIKMMIRKAYEEIDIENKKVESAGKEICENEKN